MAAATPATDATIGRRLIDLLGPTQPLTTFGAGAGNTQTEALVAIDVNTGRFVGKDALEETVFAVNHLAEQVRALGWATASAGRAAAALATLAWLRGAPGAARWAKLLSMLAVALACALGVVATLRAETEVPVMHFGASAVGIALLGAWLIERYSRITHGVRWLGHLLIAGTVIGLCVDGRALLPGSSTQAEWMVTAALNVAEWLLAAMLLVGLVFVVVLVAALVLGLWVGRGVEPAPRAGRCAGSRSPTRCAGPSTSTTSSAPRRRCWCAASGGLFRGATWFLTPDTTTDPERYRMLHGFVASLGAVPVAVDGNAARNLLPTGWIENDPVLTLDQLFDLLSKPEIGAVFALSQQDNPRAQQALRSYAEREGIPEATREKAIFWLGQQQTAENATYLRSLYGKLKSLPADKQAEIEAQLLDNERIESAMIEAIVPG